MTLEHAVLQYLASEELCSAFELAQCVHVQGGTAADAEGLLAAWSARGWLAVHPQGEPSLPDLLRLTDQAFRDLPWLAPAI
jgi:hypothetical protein